MINVNPRRQKGTAREMSVIGRLDGQVEEVIINPVGRRPADKDDDAPPARPAPPEPSEATTEPREQQRGERHEADELPVWLL